jgi:hypothetical protein
MLQLELATAHRDHRIIGTPISPHSDLRRDNATMGRLKQAESIEENLDLRNELRVLSVARKRGVRHSMACLPQQISQRESRSCEPPSGGVQISDSSLPV